VFKAVEAEIVLVELFVAIPTALEDVVDMVRTWEGRKLLYIYETLCNARAEKEARQEV